jgi:uncharacterized protein (TIGR02453 family)
MDMPPTYVLHPALDFLNDLSHHNDRPWFNAHRAAYDAARLAFETFVDDLIDCLRFSDNLQDLAAKDCLARIYRDVRFSKDKSPYKTNFGALIGRGGWKTPNLLGYFISLEPGGKSMAAGGLHDPTSEQLTHFRQTIDRDARVFQQVTQAKDFVKEFGAVAGERLKTAPKGYDRDHPHIDLLQLKQVYVMHTYADGEVLAHDFADRVVEACRAMKPFLTFLSGVIQQQ